VVTEVAEKAVGATEVAVVEEVVMEEVGMLEVAMAAAARAHERVAQRRGRAAACTHENPPNGKRAR
jgi:hypothetical protein